MKSPRPMRTIINVLIGMLAATSALVALLIVIPLIYIYKVITIGASEGHLYTPAEMHRHIEKCFWHLNE